MNRDLLLHYGIANTIIIIYLFIYSCPPTCRLPASGVVSCTRTWACYSLLLPSAGGMTKVLLTPGSRTQDVELGQ